MRIAPSPDYGNGVWTAWASLRRHPGSDSAQTASQPFTAGPVRKQVAELCTKLRTGCLESGNRRCFQLRFLSKRSALDLNGHLLRQVQERDSPIDREMAFAFNEQRFQQRFDKALAEVLTVLETERQPVIAGNCAHIYDDKYALTAGMLNNSIAATMEGESRLPIEVATAL
jgi:hypothetical protein